MRDLLGHGWEYSSLAGCGDQFWTNIVDPVLRKQPTLGLADDECRNEMISIASGPRWRMSKLLEGCWPGAWSRARLLVV